MANELLLDTGGLVSLLDKSQRQHPRFLKFFDEWQRTVVTTEAVLTEATHLLSRVPGGSKACIDFILAGGALLVPATTATLRRTRLLLDKYSDLPIDYADATLIVLAEDLNTDLILTTDHRDFSVYRIKGRKPFQILP